MDREVVKTIAKLLELAKSPCNEHEAARAAEKAKELLERYNLSLGEVELAAADSAETHFLCPQNPPRYLVVLVHAIEVLFDCATIQTTEGLFGPSCIAICGVPQNVQAAALTLHYLRDSIERMASSRSDLLVLKRSNSRRANLKRRMSYFFGAAIRVAREIEEARAKVEANERRQTMVRVSNAIANRHLEKYYPHRRTVKRRRPNLDVRAFWLGHADGARIQPHGVHKSLPATVET